MVIQKKKKVIHSVLLMEVRKLSDEQELLVTSPSDIYCKVLVLTVPLLSTREYLVDYT